MRALGAFVFSFLFFFLLGVVKVFFLFPEDSHLRRKGRQRNRNTGGTSGQDAAAHGVFSPFPAPQSGRSGSSPRALPGTAGHHAAQGNAGNCCWFELLLCVVQLVLTSSDAQRVPSTLRFLSTASNRHICGRAFGVLSMI